MEKKQLKSLTFLSGLPAPQVKRWVRSYMYTNSYILEDSFTNFVICSGGANIDFVCSLTVPESRQLPLGLSEGLLVFTITLSVPISLPYMFQKKRRWQLSAPWMFGLVRVTTTRNQKPLYKSSNYMSHQKLIRGWNVLVLGQNKKRKSHFSVSTFFIQP